MCLTNTVWLTESQIKKRYLCLYFIMIYIYVYTYIHYHIYITYIHYHNLRIIVFKMYILNTIIGRVMKNNGNI